MKKKKSKYMVEVYDLPKSPKSFFIDGIILEGEYVELMKKMSNVDFVKSIGIHESLWFEKFRLVEESDVDFPLNL